jgi:hypothetical protein
MGKIHCFLEKFPFFPRELGPFHGENLLLLEKVVVFPWELFLLFVKVDFRGTSLALE